MTRTKRNTKSRSGRRSHRSRGGRGGYCQSLLSNKIRQNIREFKSGTSRFKSIASAKAASYSQVQKMFPGCKAVFTKRRNNK